MKTIQCSRLLVLLALTMLTSSVATAQSNDLPAVSITASMQSISESNGVSVITVKRTNAIENDLTVFYTLTESGIAGQDYVDVPRHITIPAGAYSNQFSIVAIDDSIAERQETALVSLQTNAHYRFGSPFKSSVWIRDNDNLMPSVQIVNPTNNAAFATPTNILLQASASDRDGTVTRVYFYKNGFLIGSTTNATSSGMFGLLWTNVQPGSYMLKALAMDDLGGSAYSEAVNITVTGNYPPSVTLVSPTNGSVFYLPATITLKASAWDSDGTIKAVSFFKNDDLLGTQTNRIGEFYTFAWNPSGSIATGPCSIKAKAVDNMGATTTSAAVLITLQNQTNNTTLPTITVTASDAHASEVSSNSTGALNPGVFRISRSGGNTNASLTVYFGMSGTAARGVDYPEIPLSVIFQAGSLNREVVINPIDDKLVEGTETAILTVKTNSAYKRGEVHSATVSIEDNDRSTTNLPPLVRISSPTNNARFTAPANLTIFAEASDPGDGTTNGHWVHTVQFFAGTNSLGIATNCIVCANVENPFHVRWTNVPAGTYTLKAKATDNEGAVTLSEPIQIFVHEPESPRAIVSITAIDTEAREGATSNTSSNTATFKISRSGNTNVALTVLYSIQGTATNGVDYQHINDAISMAAGVREAHVVIRPIDDSIFEDIETVILKVLEPPCIAIYPPPPECYLVGSPSNATIYIFDNDVVTNAPPTVRITSPTNNAVFSSPASIELSAEASDSDGHVTVVDFYFGDHWIGSDQTAPYSLVWSNVPSGSYTLSARATDNSGAKRWSEPIKVTVRNPVEHAFVRRSLPLWYVPGVKFLVQLRAEPRTNVLSYSVEDLAPTNWVKSAISHGGYLDTDKKVKFGPFNDAQPRTLTYEVTPPENQKGERRFVGNGIADEVVSPIFGNSVIHSAPVHPADRNPTNFVMTFSEVTNYSGAWRKCERWPVSPNPIPLNYVSRAGYLYQNGGGYTISTNRPTPFPPLLWVPTNGSVVITPSTNDVSWATTNLGTAHSVMPTNYNVGVPFTVIIGVAPNSRVSAYAVEERVPAGWSVSNVSHEGRFCAMTSKVRWGVFLDNSPRELSYSITASTNRAPYVAEFTGAVSFDGYNAPITGQRRTRRTTTTEPPRLEPVKTMTDGNRLLTFSGEPGVGYTLEASTNFLDWEPLDALLNNDGTIQYIDLQTNNVFRFYRVVPNQ